MRTRYETPAGYLAARAGVADGIDCPKKGSTLAPARCREFAEAEKCWCDAAVAAGVIAAKLATLGVRVVCELTLAEGRLTVATILSSEERRCAA